VDERVPEANTEDPKENRGENEMSRGRDYPFFLFPVKTFSGSLRSICFAGRLLEIRLVFQVNLPQDFASRMAFTISQKNYPSSKNREN